MYNVSFCFCTVHTGQNTTFIIPYFSLIGKPLFFPIYLEFINGSLCIMHNNCNKYSPNSVIEDGKAVTASP